MLKNKLLENNKFVLLISFVLAVFMWSFVIVYQSNTDTVVIRDVPISTSYVQSQYSNLGLDVISTSIESVNVSVSGIRSVVGNVEADDIVVYPIITNVEGPGEYTLTLTAQSLSTINDITIDSLSSNDVTIYFDKVITRELPIIIDASNIYISESFLAGEVYTNPENIIITGPESEVMSIYEVQARVEDTENLSQTQVLEAQIVLLDENLNEIKSDVITLSQDTVDVTVPVLKELKLPVVVDYTNIPEGFDTDVLNTNINPREVIVGVPSTIAASVTEYVAGYIDLKNIQLDTPYDFVVEYPLGYMPLDTVTNISASISSNNILEKSVTVSDIRIVNGSEDDIEIVTTEITNVILIGSKSVVNDIEGTQVIAQIDASKISLTQGTQTATVEFIIPSSEEVFVKSSHTVTIRN